MRTRAPFWRKDILTDGTSRWFEPFAAAADAGADEAAN
jgi:hypothetical protein